MYPLKYGLYLVLTGLDASSAGRPPLFQCAEKLPSLAGRSERTAMVLKLAALRQPRIWASNHRGLLPFGSPEEEWRWFAENIAMALRRLTEQSRGKILSGNPVRAQSASMPFRPRPMPNGCLIAFKLRLDPHCQQDHHIYKWK